jgi:hypothetical protein
MKIRIYRQKSFITLDPGLNLIRIFTDVVYECSKQAKVFVPGEPFQPSLMSVGKAGAYSRVEYLKGSRWGRLRPASETLDWAGKAYQGQTFPFFSTLADIMKNWFL